MAAGRGIDMGRPRSVEVIFRWCVDGGVFVVPWSNRYLRCWVRWCCRSLGIDGNLFLLLELATAFGEDPREGGINIFAVVGVCLRVSVVWSDGRLKATCGAMARVVKTAKCAVAHIALALAAASGSHG